MGDPATVVVVVDDVGDTAKPLSLSWSTWRLSTWVVDDDVAMVIDLGRRRRGDGGGRPGSSSWVIDVAMAVVDVDVAVVVADVDVAVMSFSSSSSSTWPRLS